MKPGMWTSYLHELSPEDMVVWFAEKDWLHLELSDEHGAELLRRGSPEGVGSKLRTFAEDHAVRFPQGHLWLKFDITAKDPQESLDDLKPWLDLFDALGVRACVLHPGGKALLDRGVDSGSVRGARIEALGAITDYLRDTDLVICLENMARMEDAGQLLDLIQGVGATNLGICLDTGHLHLAGGNPAEFVLQSGDLLQALHIADNEGETDQHLMPFGRGTVDWDGFVPALKRIGYEGLYNFE
ncbi:MAG: sugar phosphate isomerase/epimerase, partial [Candidatus Latescibacteria bacterium]|nr:sugar phosphate isomerase/epimerase [Candidatus Latescibacterota bacterium]